MFRRMLLLAAALLAPASLAQAQTPQPGFERPIRIIVPIAPGGGTDVFARLLAEIVGSSLGQPIVVENRPGASSTIGTQFVAEQRPDGTTLLLSPIGAMAIQPHFRADLPYRPTDFAPICQVADTPVVVMSAPQSPLRSLSEVISRAREAKSATTRCLKSDAPTHCSPTATRARSSSSRPPPPAWRLTMRTTPIRDC